MIDLLVISHFDYDHISGVRDLLSSCSVVEVVLPYLSDEEILMVLLDKKNKVSEMEDWYFDFFLLYSNVSSVRMIYSEKGINKKDEWFNKIESPPYDGGLDKQGIEVKFVTHEDDFLVDKFLKFRIFNYAITEEKRRSFYAKIHEYRENLEGDVSNQMLCYYVLQSNDRMKSFKRCYGFITTNHNNVSLVTSYEYQLSSPNYRTGQLEQLEKVSEKYPNPLVENHEKEQQYELRLNKVVHLLTGDISIAYAYKHRQVYEHYKEQLKEMNFVQVPQHGSRHNWNVDLLKQVPKYTIFIISHGGRHGHPHGEVTKSIQPTYGMVCANKTDRVVFYQGL